MATRFVKYKISIVKVENTDYIKQEYEKISDTGNKLGDGPTYGYVRKEFTRDDETKVLEMEIQDEKDFDLNRTVKAILGL